MARVLDTYKALMERPLWLRYGAGIIFVGIALVVRAAFDPFLGDAHPFPFFLGATAVAAWYGGLGPALMALVLGYLAADWYFTQPRYAFSDWSPHSLFSIAVYAVNGLLISLVIHAAQRANRLNRRRAAQLQHERERFRTTLASIGDAVITTDTGGLVTFINAVGERITGWTHQEACGKPLHEIFKIHNELTRKPVDNPAGKVLREGAIVGLANHTVLVTQDGREIPIDDSAAPIRDASGELVGTILVFRDVTEQRTAELAMRRLASIIENSDDAIIGKDLKGIVTSWNKSAERIFGYRAAEMLGKPITTLIPADRQNEEQDILGRLQRGERMDHFETVRQTKDGREIQVSLTISPIKDAEGRIVGASKIAREITERKRIEAALLKAREELIQANRMLEDKIAERTASLQQSLKSMETVLYTIAHDLRGPNRAMQGFAQLLASEYGSKLDEEGRSYINRISNAALKNDTLICDLLEYGRLAHAELPMSNVDLGQSIQKVIQDLQPHISSKNATIELDQSWPTVWANESVLSQIITNLLTNALKFVAPGVAPRVRVWAEQIDGENAAVRLHVDDNGIGIPAEIQGRLFQPFQRGTTDPKYQGTGMGLAIVQKGAERLGGKVGLNSMPGKGSFFWMELLPGRRVETAGAREKKDRPLR